ncbi:MAG: hypothetical protein IKH77_04675 [Clostridia bacterium]|nr:hypothetical protein [Clostridia bacterium]
MITIITMGIALISNALAFILCAICFVRLPKQWRKYFPAFVFVLFMIGYCIESSRVTDMTRYFLQISQCRGMSLQEAVVYQNDNLYVKDFFFWLSAQLEMPHLMTGMPVALVMGVMIYIACDYIEDNDQHKYLWLVVFLMLARTSLSALANNIRNISAFAIAVLAVYREIKQKKRNLLTLILYILPVFIHATGIILVAVRLLIPLVRRYRAVTLVLVFLLPGIIEFAYANVASLPLSGSLGTIIRRMVYSAHNYLAGESAYAQAQVASTNAQIKRVIAFTRLFFTTGVLYMEMKEEGKPSAFKIYTFILAVLALSCVAFNTPAYWRFSTALGIANMPMYVNILSGKTKLKNWPSLLKLGLAAYSLITIVLRIDTVMDDVNIRYFVEEFLLTNAFTMGYHAAVVTL